MRLLPGSRRLVCDDCKNEYLRFSGLFFEINPKKQARPQKDNQPEATRPPEAPIARTLALWFLAPFLFIALRIKAFSELLKRMAAGFISVVKRITTSFGAFFKKKLSQLFLIPVKIAATFILIGKNLTKAMLALLRQAGLIAMAVFRFLKRAALAPFLFVFFLGRALKKAFTSMFERSKGSFTSKKVATPSPIESLSQADTESTPEEDTSSQDLQDIELSPIRINVSAYKWAKPAEASLALDPKPAPTPIARPYPTQAAPAPTPPPPVHRPDPPDVALVARRSIRSLMSVIDRMIVVDLLKTVLSILLVLVIIIVSKKFLGMLTQAIDGEVSADTLFRLLGLRTLSATTVLIPPATFMAVLTVMGRMYRDHEMAILASAGVGTIHIYKSITWLIIPLLIFSAFMSLEVMPWTEKESQAIQKRDKETADIRGIKPGRFNEFSSGDVVLYAEEMTEDNVLHNIFVQSRQGTMTGVVLADRGHLQKSETGDDFMVLNEGRRYQGTPGQMDYTISDFEEYGVRVGGPEEEGEEKKREAEDTLQLIQGQTPRELAELQKRLAVPLGVFALALLAVPLSRVAPRSGPYGSVLSAFMIYIIYENAQKITQGMLMAERIPPWLAYTLIYGLLTIMTLSLLAKNLGSRWIKHQLGGRQL